MRLLISLVAITLPVTAFAQYDRYASQPAADSNSADLTELPFSNEALPEAFDATDLGAPQARQPVAPPQTERIESPPAERPSAAPAAAAPQTYEPTSPQGSGASESEASTSRYAESLMRAALSAPSGSQLTGDPLYLADVIRAVGSRSEQSEAIGAYWDLCSAVADYYLSLHEQAELERLAARTGQASMPLRDAVEKLKTRRDTALTASRASQLRLASLMGRRASGSLPLPGDMPWCGVYHTRYSQNFTSGGPREAAELNQLLPLRHKELLSAAAAVADAEDWFNEVARRANEDQGEAVVNALQFLALNRRAFVQISRDYNKRITRYTELARPGNLRTERLVSMLIKPADNVASRTTPAASPPPGRRSGSGPPPTFREFDNDSQTAAAPRIDTDVQQAAAEEQFNRLEKVAPGERSVLSRDRSE